MSIARVCVREFCICTTAKGEENLGRVKHLNKNFSIAYIPSSGMPASGLYTGQRLANAGCASMSE